jgi:hypothetical protein
MAGDWNQQVLRLAATLWAGERAQRLDSSGLLAGSLGERSYHPVSWRTSAGRISTAGFHDAGRRCRGREPIQCVAGAARRGIVIALEG